MRRKLSYWVLALLAPLGFVNCSQEELAPSMEEIRLHSPTRHLYRVYSHESVHCQR